jgi:hypothetical protein
MPSACGLACEVCGLREQGFCPIDGCVPGTDPAAQEKLEKFTVAVGHPCFILECAIKNRVDHCTRCPEFPCPIHYQQGLYSEKLLDMIKGMRGKE